MHIYRNTKWRNISVTLYESLKEFLTIHENISPYPIQRTMNYSPRATMHTLKVLVSTRLVRKLNIKTHLHPQPTPKHVPAPASGIHQMWRVCTMSFLSILMYAIVYGYAIPCLLSSYEMYGYITYISLPPDHFSFILFHILSCFLTFSRFFFFICVCVFCVYPFFFIFLHSLFGNYSDTAGNMSTVQWNNMWKISTKSNGFCTTGPDDGQHWGEVEGSVWCY